ncbi:hypothetical protein BC830DRAFT_178779 [Chytriomyces sp. MP71]|nr:hypothetical protein BC830DRAFT_178779 [Chytriomyces sp. MP71]
MIAIESETANLLNWLIKEGRILEQDDDTEAAMEVEAEERAEELRACSLNDVGRTSQGMRKSSSAQSLTARPRSRSKLGGSPLAQTASLTTLYASSMAIAGAITGKSERFLATSSPAASTDNAPPSPNPTHQRTRTSSVSHLRLSVSSLSKVCESKLPSSLTSMEARILAQLSQIAVLLKAVLALQEETSKQLWDSRKRFKIMEVQVGMLGEWRDCVMQRVGMLNVDKVPIVDTQSAQEISASMDLTREISKKLQSLKNQTNAFLIQMEA